MDVVGALSSMGEGGRVVIWVVGALSSVGKVLGVRKRLLVCVGGPDSYAVQALLPFCPVAMFSRE